MVVTRSTGIAADETRLVGFLDGSLQIARLVIELAADVNIRCLAAHGETGDQTAFQQHMGVEAQDLAILAGPGLGLIGIDYEEGGPRRIRLFGHEGPFEASGESRSAAPTQIGFLDLVHDGIATALDQALGVVP